MQKQTKVLIACLIALILLMGGVVFVLNWEGKAEETVTNERIALLTTEKEQIKQISLETEDEIIEFLNEGEEKGFSVRGLEDVPLAKETLDAIITSCMALEASQEVDAKEPLDLAVYGLDTPRTKVKVVLEAGTESVLYIGDEAPGYVGNYALFNEKLYIIDSSTAMNFDKTLYDFVSDEIVPMKTSEVYIEEVQLQNLGKETIHLSYVPEETVVAEKEETEESTTEEPATESTKQAGGEAAQTEAESIEETVIPAYYKMIAPYEKDLTSYDVTSWTDGIFSLYASDITAINAQEAEYREYGFDKPVSILELKMSDGQSYKLTVSYFNNNYYLKCNEVPIIYCMNASELTWIDKTTELLFKSIFNAKEKQDVAKLIIQTAQETFEIIPNQEGITQEEFEIISGNVLYFQPTKVEAIDTFEFEKVGSIELTYKDGSRDILELFPTGEGSLYMVLNGRCEYTTSESSFTYLLDKYHASKQEA